MSTNLLVQVKTGLNTSGNRQHRLLVIGEFAQTTGWYDIPAPAAGSFDTYEIQAPFGVLGARGVFFEILGELGAEWELAFVNITDASQGIWRWEPHHVIKIAESPELRHRYTVGQYSNGVGGDPYYDSGHWSEPATSGVENSDAKEICLLAEIFESAKSDSSASLPFQHALLTRLIIKTQRLNSLQQQGSVDPLLDSYQRDLAAVEAIIKKEALRCPGKTHGDLTLLDGYPQDGHVYSVLNPFITSPTPQNYLTAVPSASAGFFTYEAQFTNWGSGAKESHWRFIRVGDVPIPPSPLPIESGLFKIKNLSIPDNPDPRLYRVRGPFLVRSGHKLFFDAESSGPAAVWRVDTYDEFAFYFYDPDHLDQQLYAKFLGTGYWPIVGQPDQISAGDIRLSEAT